MTFSSNQQLVDSLEQDGFIQSLSIKEAFLVADRKKFIPVEFSRFAYFDQPIPIGEQQTISQPATVAFMLELLAVQPGQRVLDVGAGSGWVTALLAHLVGTTGWIQAYELKKRVGQFGQKAVVDFKLKNVEYLIADAAQYWTKKGLFDRIYVGAAFRKIPSNLILQLKDDGILVAPTQQNDLRKITRVGDKFEETIYPGFVFVPFLDNKK